MSSVACHANYLRRFTHQQVWSLSLQPSIGYETLAKLSVGQPVDRLTYLSEACRGRSVLDVGCFDETALAKRDTEHWLHGRIVELASRVVGVDSSSQIPDEGLETGLNASIVRGDGVNIDPKLIARERFDVIVAGEFIEHIDNPLLFFTTMKLNFPGRTLLISTPNGACFANTLMGLIGREVQHPDHLHNFSFKILHTLCRRAGLESWEVIPYRFYATEMILASTGVKRVFVILVERSIRLVERLFPLLSFGYIVRAKL